MTGPGNDDAGRLPTFLVIGASKAGTTSLHFYLATHPEVFMSSEKEVHFFDDRYAEGIDWYRRNFAGARDAKAVGETSPTYMHRRDAMERIAAVLPGARLVAVLRHPVDRAWSHYWFQRSLGFERASFADAVRAEMRDPTSVPLRHLEAGRYVEHLRMVVELFPRQQLLVLLLDDLIRDRRGTFAGVCRFIGVDASFVPPNLDQRYNESTRLRSERLRHAMLKYRAWKRFGRLATVVDRLNRYQARYPSIDAAMRAELVTYYASSNAELGAWLGRDLTHWNA